MDYCTLFPEGWWAACCALHDEAYAGVLSRLLADEQLRECVATSNPEMYLLSAGIASLMYLGVRLFGSRFYKAQK